MLLQSETKIEPDLRLTKWWILQHSDPSPHPTLIIALCGKGGEISSALRSCILKLENMQHAFFLPNFVINLLNLCFINRFG